MTITRINPEYQPKGSYLPYTDYGQTKKDLNDLTANGVYSVYNPTNAPWTNQWLIVFVLRFNSSGNYVLQVAFPRDKNMAYKRRSSGGTVGAWTSVAFS